MVLPDMREIVMTHAGHGIWKCSCGQVVKQCRCPDKNKPVHIVQNGCDACHTMTTPTTGTAPLIERIERMLYEADLFQHFPGVDKSARDIITAALGDVLVIESREQAKTTITDELQLNTSYSRQHCFAIALNIIAALTGENDRE
jgi:hypothetical protein